VLGRSGAGKTTFKASFIYQGAIRYGEEGVYVGLGEPKDKFMRNMLKLGMDFYELGRKGLFKFINLLSLADIGLIEFFITYLTRYVKEMGQEG